MPGNLIHDYLKHADFEDLGGFTDGMEVTCDDCGCEIDGEPLMIVDHTIRGHHYDVAELCDDCAPL